MAKSDISMGINIKNCAECEKNNIGMKMYELFEPKFEKPNFFIKYKDGICYLNEQILMSIIRMANPYQQERKIKVVSRDEFKKLFEKENK